MLRRTVSIEALHAGAAAAARQAVARINRTSGARAGTRPRVGVQRVLPICTTCGKIGHKKTNCRWAKTAAGKEILRLQKELRDGAQPQADVAAARVAARPLSHTNRAADQAGVPFTSGISSAPVLSPARLHLGSAANRPHLANAEDDVEEDVVEEEAQVLPALPPAKIHLGRTANSPHLGNAEDDLLGSAENRPRLGNAEDDVQEDIVEEECQVLPGEYVPLKVEVDYTPPSSPILIE